MAQMATHARKSALVPSHKTQKTKETLKSTTTKSSLTREPNYGGGGGGGGRVGGGVGVGGDECGVVNEGLISERLVVFGDGWSAESLVGRGVLSEG